MTTTIDERAVAGTLRDLFAGSGDDATRALTSFGIEEFLAEDLPLAVHHVFHEQGAAAARSAALPTVLSVVLARHVPGLRAGVALGDERLVLGTPEHILVREPDGLRLLETGDRRLTPVSGIDPALGLHRVDSDDAGHRLLDAEPAAAAWADLVAWGRIALSWELVGGCRSALSLAREHAAVREQFGRPIGEFQAVAHRLAEARVAIDAAESVLALAADPIEPLLAATAKYLAGRAYELTAKNCLQVLGGIGFTAEHPFDRYLRRGFALDQLLGSRARLAGALGTELFDRGHAPLLCHLDRSPA